MSPLPHLYLHLETGALPIFLAMVLLVQLARSNDPGYYTQSGRKQLVWLFIGFVALTFVFGAFLYNVSPILAVELAAGFTISLLHPVNALCFFVHMLFLRPWEIVTNNAILLALPRLLAILCFISWLIHPAQHVKPTLVPRRALFLFLGFSLWLFLTTFQTPDIAATQVDWLNTYFRALVVFVMCLFFIESETSVKEFEMTLVISAIALMIIGCYQYLFAGTESGRLESVGVFADPNDLAAVAIMALPLAVVPLFRHPINLARQLFGLLFSGFSLAVIWFTKSRGAMLALAAQALTARYLRSAREKKWLGFVCLVGFLSVGYFVVLKAIPRDTEEMEASQESRVTYWKAAINMTLHHPVWGVGFDQYPVNYDDYSTGTKYEWGLRTAHSSWFLALAESGVLGGLLYITFFLTVLRTAWRNRQKWPAQLYALVGFIIVMTFLSHTYSLYPYMLAGLVLASASLRDRSKDGI